MPRAGISIGNDEQHAIIKHKVPSSGMRIPLDRAELTVRGETARAFKQEALKATFRSLEGC